MRTQNFLALVPLALLLGEVTEDLALRFGDVIGGLLVGMSVCGNATQDLPLRFERCLGSCTQCHVESTFCTLKTKLLICTLKTKLLPCRMPRSEM